MDSRRLYCLWLNHKVSQSRCFESFVFHQNAYKTHTKTPPCVSHTYIHSIAVSILFKWLFISTQYVFATTCSYASSSCSLFRSQSDTNTHCIVYCCGHVWLLEVLLMCDWTTSVSYFCTFVRCIHVLFAFMRQSKVYEYAYMRFLKRQCLVVLGYTISIYTTYILWFHEIEVSRMSDWFYLRRF